MTLTKIELKTLTKIKKILKQKRGKDSYKASDSKKAKRT